MSKRFGLALFMVLALLTPINTACAPTMEPEVAEEEAPEIEPEYITLRVSGTQVGMPLGQYELIDALHRAAEELSTEWGITVEVSGGDSQALMMAGGEGCSSAALAVAPGFDIYLLDSPSALHAFEQHPFAPVPEELFGDYLESMYPPGRRVFSSPDGALLGVAQATVPLSIIYNPMIMLERGYDLGPAISVEDFIEIVGLLPIAVPPHSGIAVAAAHTVLGPDFTFALLFTAPDLFERVAEAEGLLRELLATGNVYTMDTPGIAQQFAGEELAWTIHDGRFLALLAQQGYDGPIATMQLPIYRDTPGHSAMGIGWAVSAESENQELAWALIEKLVQDPQVIRWYLSKGMLPISESGFDRLVAEGLADGLLPAGLLGDDPELRMLRVNAAESELWRVPLSVSPEAYNELVPISNELLVALVNQDLTLQEAVGEWTGLVIEARGQ